MSNRIHVHDPPMGENERTTMREYTGLCGRSFYGVGYLNADHLRNTVKSYGDDGGPGWGNFCLDCKRAMRNDPSAATEAPNPGEPPLIRLVENDPSDGGGS